MGIFGVTIHSPNPLGPRRIIIFCLLFFREFRMKIQANIFDMIILKNNNLFYIKVLEIWSAHVSYHNY